MSELLWFAVWAVAIVLMMRFGCGAHVMGHRKSEHEPRVGEEPRWEAPDTDTDPVCAKKVKTADAKPSVFDGHVYYFCSRECREVFEAAPETYVKGSADTSIERLGGSHA